MKGEWRGLAVSIEDCHSKGWRFKSPSVLFFSQEGMLSDVSLASGKTDKTGQDTHTGGFNKGETARREMEQKELESGTKQYDEEDSYKKCRLNGLRRQNEECGEKIKTCCAI